MATPHRLRHHARPPSNSSGHESIVTLTMSLLPVTRLNEPSSVDQIGQNTLAWASVRECPLKALAAMPPGTTNDPRDRIRRSVGGLECLGLWPNESSRYAS